MDEVVNAVADLDRQDAAGHLGGEGHVARVQLT
jgi:hypothetical protein